MSTVLKFPENVLWGCAESGHQIEGSNQHSDWWLRELVTPEQPVSGKAVDYGNRFEEDHELLAAIGHQAFRIGIEWARIEPRVLKRRHRQHQIKIRSFSVRPAALPFAQPCSDKSTSVQPVKRFSLLQIRSPWRRRTTCRTARFGLSEIGIGDVLEHHALGVEK
jgi:hypothetical protein